MKMLMRLLLSSIIALAAFAEVKETAHLKVTGGKNAGSYEATTDRGGCSAGLTGLNSFGNQLSSAKDQDPKHFNSLQLIVPDPKKPSEFFMSVGFGPLLHRSAEYKVETRAGQKKSGLGVVNVKNDGSTAKVTFNATTADGVKLDGTIDCNSVIRAK
jgi:hypothetical protein